MRVNINELSSLDGAFSSSVRKLAEIQDQLLHLSRSMAQETVSQRFGQAMRDVTELTSGHARDMRLLARTLDSILKEYTETEHRIQERASDYSEGFTLMSTGLIHFPIVCFDRAYFAIEEPDLIEWEPWIP